MALVEYARRELQAAGWFDKDGMYDGMIGDAVLELVETFAKQGHSGGSAHLVLGIFSRVAAYKPLEPLPNPMCKNEYIVVDDALTPTNTEAIYQSTRRSSLFSDDGGKSWYDIDRYVPWWKRLFGVRRFAVKFPYKVRA